ncbi:MAG: hypothetical protein WCH76_08430, partial [Candidatus Riflemargulisbacteria bacterium]
MKKFRVLLLLVTVLLMTSMSFSLLKVEGTYSVFAKQGGVGIGIGLPLVPLLDTTVYIHMLGDANVTASANYSGETFSGTTKMSATAVEVQAKLPISIMDFNVGGTVLVDILTGKESIGGKSVALPGSVYGGLFVHYQKSLMPLVSYYGQMGMLFKVIDGEKALNDKVTTGEFDMSNIDRSGMYFRAGLS